MLKYVACVCNSDEDSNCTACVLASCGLFVQKHKCEFHSYHENIVQVQWSLNSSEVILELHWNSTKFTQPFFKCQLGPYKFSVFKCNWVFFLLESSMRFTLVYVAKGFHFWKGFLVFKQGQPGTRFRKSNCFPTP